MTITTRSGELDERFSSPDATPTPWSSVRDRLEGAETYWITTIRDDGRPHSTPLVGVWLDDAFWFSTGASEQKARNLEHNRDVLVAVGSSTLDGLDVVVEGRAERITSESRLLPVAAAYNAKNPPLFRSEVHDGAFRSGDMHAIVFEVRPAKILAFRKDDRFAQTRFVLGD